MQVPLKDYASNLKKIMGALQVRYNIKYAA